METIYVGIDIAKDSFEFSFPNTALTSLSNQETGWQKLLSILPTNAHCVLEYTGVYSLGLATFLYAENYGKVLKSKPKSIKRGY